MSDQGRGLETHPMRQVKFKSHGLSEPWVPESLPGCDFQGTVESRDPARTAILFYDWTPELVHAAYDITPVEEQARAEGRENVNLDKEDWLEASHFHASAATQAFTSPIPVRWKPPILRSQDPSAG